MKTILLIDDNEEFRESVSVVLSDAGFDVWEASCPDKAFSILRKEDFDLILCDLHMPFTDEEEKIEEYALSYKVGVETVKELAWVYPKMPIVALSAASPSDLWKISNQLYPIPAFTKPAHYAELLGLVHKFLEHRELEVVH